MTALWLVIRLVLIAPWLVVRVLWQRRFGQLPASWPVAYGVAVAVLRFVVGAAIGPLMAGRKSNLPSPPVLGRLSRSTERRAVKLAGRDAEWLTPAGPSPLRCVLYLHGGAFVTGSIGTHRQVMAQLAHVANARVVGLDYRLAPEYRFPAGLEDCLAAWEELLAAGELPQNMAIAGDSAGGGLTASMLLALRDRGLPLPAAAWLLSPAVDLLDERPSWHDNLPYDYLAPIVAHRELFVPTYLGRGGDASQPLVSPVRGTLGGLPPLLIHVGEKEVLRDQIIDYAARATAAGVEVTLVVGRDMVHVYPAFLGLTPLAAEAFVQAGAFLKAKIP